MFTSSCPDAEFASALRFNFGCCYRWNTWGGLAGCPFAWLVRGKVVSRGAFCYAFIVRGNRPVWYFNGGITTLFSPLLVRCLALENLFILEFSGLFSVFYSELLVFSVLFPPAEASSEFLAEV